MAHPEVALGIDWNGDKARTKVNAYGESEWVQ